ncbi:MAG: ribonuclease E/G [Clostridia bacterium]|nr:ribonuclease E/G [Clostridia bacterium]
MREIWIRTGENGQDIAILEDGHLVEYLPGERESAAEAILMGRVDRVVPGMKAAFVHIGQEKAGFLPLEESGRGLPPLRTGDRIMVQIRKAAQGVKGAFLTRDVNLAGEYVLLSPVSRQIAVSSRITREADRKRLKALGRAVAADRFGLVMRTSAQDADEALLREEAEQLWTTWQAVARAAPTAHVPSVLHAPRTLLDAVIDDYRPRGIDRIVSNDAALLSRMEQIAPTLHMGDNLFHVGRISNQLAQGLERRVWLKSGGNLVFDPCEAMTVIDVNTAKFTGERSLEETVLQLNLEAAAEIARQVRLRNCSGIIIIDMIDMHSAEHRQRVLKELESCFAADRVKTVVHGLTSLGLVEMTRRRTRPPLREVMKQQAGPLDMTDAPASEE